MDKTPTCPYCGGEMELMRYAQAYWYECLRAGCRTHSPAAGSEEDALGKAMHNASLWANIGDEVPYNGTICVVHGHNKRGVDCYDIAIKIKAGWEFGSASGFEVEHWMAVPDAPEEGECHENA